MFIVRFLKAPHPANTSYGLAFWSAVIISVFVALFLMAFQPFGLGDMYGPYKYLFIASYGLPCLPPDLLLGFGLVYWCRKRDMGEHWKVWHALVVILVHILIISASNYWYQCLLLHHSLSYRGLYEMELDTALVGVFPALGTFLSSRAFLVSKNEAVAEELNESIDQTPKPAVAQTVPEAAKTVTLRGENNAEVVTAAPERVCYLKSDGNYVEVILSNPDGKPQTLLLRAALKDIEAQLAGQCAAIVRCHRSYLVNKQRIASAEGNALGLTLTLDQSGLEVPVSRSFVEQFRG